MKPQDRVPRLKSEDAVNTSKGFAGRLRSFLRELSPTLRLMALTIKWGRVPNDWELAFIAKMRGLQKSGIRFDRVLKITLPRLFGEESEILNSWVGEKAGRNPERFVRSVSKMWGPSAHSVIISLDRLTNDKGLFESKANDPPYKSLLEAIQKSDAAKVAGSDSLIPMRAPPVTETKLAGCQVTALAVCPPTVIQLQDSERVDAVSNKSKDL